MWRKPTLEDIAATLSAKELEAFRSSTSFEAGDPVEALIQRTAEMVRSYCRANRALKVSPAEGELPESLISPAMDYAAFDILKRLPLAIGEDRRKARDSALELFEKVSQNKITPESFGVDYTEDEVQSHALPSFAQPIPYRKLDDHGYRYSERDSK
jgi:hypothetical protein